MSRKTCVTAVCATVLMWTLATGASAQQTNFPGFEETPGLYFYRVQPGVAWGEGQLISDFIPVVDRVSGKNALRLTFTRLMTSRSSGPEAPPFRGIVVYRPPGGAISDRETYRALSFWFKGDGSLGKGVISIGTGADTDPRAEFKLISKTWQPVRIAWTDFDPPVTVGRIDAITFSVTADTQLPATYLIDRFELVRTVENTRDDDEVKKRGEAFAKLPDPGIPEDLSPFVTHRDALAGLRAKINEKKPVRVLVVGDAITQGVLWNVPDGAGQPRARFLYWGRLEETLRTAGAAPDVKVSVAADPTEAAARVPVLLRRLQPALVIVQFSSSPGGENWRTLRTDTRAAYRAIFDACRKASVDVVAIGVPPIPSRYKVVDEAAVLLDEATRAKVPAINFGSFAAARGAGYEGEFYATETTLNVRGHLYAAKLLEALLQDK